VRVVPVSAWAVIATIWTALVAAGGAAVYAGLPEYSAISETDPDFRFVYQLVFPVEALACLVAGAAIVCFERRWLVRAPLLIAAAAPWAAFAPLLVACWFNEGSAPGVAWSFRGAYKDPADIGDAMFVAGTVP
jgi:hypothetical protein